ncbi:MAG: ATP-dependent RecD-like DNA helicase, partial [Candidatus Cryptobacteroides sp.]
MVEKDIIFETAERYVNETGRSIFLTGKAGTGKTTFLKHITRTTAKRFVVLAPTGVAAINAGGTTIHSFFLLPLCPYLPDVKELVTEYQMPRQSWNYRKDKLRIIRSLDLLIIDEISMVRADLLDAVDMVLRRIRRNSKPFGGVQLLMIGDAQQLSPVVRDNEKPYISQVYPSPYFFHSKALQALPYVTIELTKVYRQKDEEFIKILNAVRDNRADGDILRRLNSRVGAFGDGEDVIMLTTHNAQADAVNRRKLDQLPGRSTVFEADVQGDFPPNMYPAEDVLQLKPGAQVMFVKNDPDGLYYNGKIAKVSDVSPDGPVTVIDSGGQSIEVEAVEWNNIQYVLDKESGEIRQNITGTFRQLPVRIAWAITIHKSQGLTFDKVIINAGSAFAFGQVYVALSRCRSLEGISLETPVWADTIYSDSHVAMFNAAIPEPESVRDALGKETDDYRFDRLKELFSFSECCRTVGWVLGVMRGKLADIYPDHIGQLRAIKQVMDRNLVVGETFCRQLDHIRERNDGEEYLKERLLKAAEYFINDFKAAQAYLLGIAGLEIDNKENKKAFREAVDEALIAVEIVVRSFDAIIGEEFDIRAYQRICAEAVLMDSAKKRKGSRRRTVEARQCPKTGEDDGCRVDEGLRQKLTDWRTAT